MLLVVKHINSKQVLFAAALIRVGFMVFSGKLHEEETWEYGQIALQLLAGHGYAFPFIDEQLNFLPGSYFPSALMPPAYVFFILPFMLVKNILLWNLLLFSVQILLSLLAMHLIFRYLQNRLGRTAAIMVLGLQAVYPELVFAVCSIGPTIWFHLLLAGILFHLPEKSQAVLVGILAGLLVLMRSEALLPLGLLLLVEFFRGHKKASLLSGLTMVLCLSPWLIDWPDNRTRHFFYWFPWLLCFPAGLWFMFRHPFPARMELAILFLSYTVVVLIFFPQARYASLIRFFWLIPAGLFLDRILPFRKKED